MQRAIQALILIVCLVPYLVTEGWLPAKANYLLEGFSAVTLLYVLAAGVRNRFELVRPEYWALFAAMLIVMVCGVVLNSVGSGPIFAGIRNYFRTLPFFFIGAVVAFSEKQVRRQLALLMLIAIVQIPIAASQRMATLERGGMTGDSTSGTLLLSHTLSVFLICGIAIVLALQRRGLISLQTMLILMVLFIIPTTINETRATFFLLPVTLMVTSLVLAKPGQRIKNVVVALFAISIFGAIFIPTYDHFIAARGVHHTTTLGIFEGDRMESKLFYDAQLGTSEQVARVDMIVVPTEHLWSDPVRLIFGYGMGNVSDSALGAGFTGYYYLLWKPFLYIGYSRVVLELGMAGLVVMLLILWCIFRDCRDVSRRDRGVFGALAAGWAGVTALFVMSLVYIDVTPIQSLSMLFWFYSGLVAAHRMRIQLHGTTNAATPAGPMTSLRR